METLKQSMTEMMEHFNKQMTAFQQEHSGSQASRPGTSKLEAEFSAFRGLITGALLNLQQQLEVLGQEVDKLDMRGRRKILLVHGVPDTKEEDTVAVVVRVVRERLNIPDFNTGDISRCHRMGRALPNASRPVLVKFQSSATKDRIWFSKKLLKGTGVTLSEFLTKRRHDAFMAARQRFGISKCWTRDGTVFVLGDDGTRHKVLSLADLSRIIASSADSSSQPDSEPSTKPKKAPVKPRQARVKKPSVVSLVRSLFSVDCHNQKACCK